MKWRFVDEKLPKKAFKINLKDKNKCSETQKNIKNIPKRYMSPEDQTKYSQNGFMTTFINSENPSRPGTNLCMSYNKPSNRVLSPQPNTQSRNSQIRMMDMPKMSKTGLEGKEFTHTNVS